MNDIIPNIFHYIYIDSTLKEYQYFSLKSVIEIYSNSIIYIHYYDNIPDGFLWNIIKEYSNIKLNKIKIPIKLHNKYENAIIYKILYDYGGIYIDFKTILLNTIDNYFNNNIIKTEDNSLIGTTKNNKIIYDIFKFYQNNPYDINNDINNEISIIKLNYEMDTNNIEYIIFNEINDYSFGKYFHMINNTSLFSFKNIDNIKLNTLSINYIFHKITIYNLLIRKILTHNYITTYNNKLLIENISKLNLINNIDKIYWINMNISKNRKKLMEDLLNNINIENERFEGIDGSIVSDICTKYFYAINNIYPQYSNKEYAILLSHLSVIEKYAMTNGNDNKYNIALICEDDLSLDFIKYWKKDFKTIIEEAPIDWEIIMLGYFSINIDKQNIYNKWNNEWSAISYLINNKNIKNKINNLKKDNLWICDENDLMVSDNYIFSKFNTYVYKYPYFTFPNNNDSTLHEDHLNYHKIYKMANYIVNENIYEYYLR